MTRIQMRELMSAEALTPLDTENFIHSLLRDLMQGVDFQDWPQTAEIARDLADTLQWYAGQRKKALR